MDQDISASQLWRRLSPEAKRTAAFNFWAEPRANSEEVRAQALGLIARTLKIRTKSAKKLKDPKKAEYLLAINACPSEVREGMLRAYLLSTQLHMITAFLEKLSIPHDRGLISGEVNLSEIAPELIKSSGSQIWNSFDHDNVRLYFWVLIDSDRVWQPLADFILANPHEQASAEADEGAEGEDAAQEIKIHEEGPTALDDLLTAAIIDSAAGVESSFSREQVLDIVDEFLHLNARRHRSYFHRGYADAMFGLGLQDHFLEETPNRLLWYWSGAIVAYARRADHSAITSLFDSQDLSVLGRECTWRSRATAQFVFDALSLSGRGSSAAQFFDPQLVPFTGSFDQILEMGTKLLRMGEIENADAILKLLESSLPFFSTDELSKGSMLNLKRRRAHCLRLKRQYREAERLLKELAAESDSDKSTVLTDLAMVSAGFRGLVDISIPEKDASGFVGRLKRIVTQLEGAALIGGDPSHAEFCLGVLALSEGHHSIAAALLERSVTKMISRPDVYGFGDLLPRARFYLALGLAETLDDNRIAYSVQLFNDAMGSGFLPPPTLLRRYIEALLMVNPDEARICAERALPDVRLGPKILEALAATDLPRRSQPILEALFAWSCDESRPKRSRFSDLKIILREALLARNMDLAENALDEMEMMAQASTCTADYLSLLSDPDSYDPAWTQTDAAWSAVRVLEGKGAYEQAAELLSNEFHRRLTSQDYGSLDEARDILLRIRTFVISGFDTSGLEGRLNTLVVTPETLPHERGSVPVCITVVGGDELESSYDEAIRSFCKGRNPSIELHFRHTSWSSNHGDQLNSMKALLDRSDAVVVMRRIRTNLGRNVRRTSKLWIGCAGASRASIQRAIMTAVDLIGSRRRASAKGSS